MIDSDFKLRLALDLLDIDIYIDKVYKVGILGRGRDHAYTQQWEKGGL